MSADGLSRKEFRSRLKKDITQTERSSATVVTQLLIFPTRRISRKRLTSGTSTSENSTRVMTMSSDGTDHVVVCWTCGWARVGRSHNAAMRLKANHEHEHANIDIGTRLHDTETERGELV